MQPGRRRSVPGAAPLAMKAGPVVHLHTARIFGARDGGFGPVSTGFRVGAGNPNSAPPPPPVSDQGNRTSMVPGGGAGRKVE